MAPDARRISVENESGSSFWTGRLQKHGHTGWANPIIYAFDQAERLKLIGAEIDRLGKKQGMALDFGCGTGDFSKLLLERGHRVCGYDPFVQPAISTDRFVYARSYDQIPFNSGEAKLALSITTLAHILNESDLSQALMVIRKCLSLDGDFFMLEYALDAEADRERFGLISDYQSCRTLEVWRRILESSSFDILNITPFPQPLISPSSGFLAYDRSLAVRITRRCSRWQILKSFQSRVLRWQARRSLQSMSVSANPDGSSPLKLLHCSVRGSR